MSTLLFILLILCYTSVHARFFTDIKATGIPTHSSSFSCIMPILFLHHSLPNTNSFSITRTLSISLTSNPPSCGFGVYTTNSPISCTYHMFAHYLRFECTISQKPFYPMRFLQFGCKREKSRGATLLGNLPA